jgi:hypothetical protein
MEEEFTVQIPRTPIPFLFAYFDGPDGERLELIAPQGPFVRVEWMAK